MATWTAAKRKKYHEEHPENLRRSVVDLLRGLPSVASEAKRLDILYRVPATPGKGDDVVGGESHTIRPATEAAIPEPVAECCPLLLRKSSAVELLSGASIGGRGDERLGIRSVARNAALAMVFSQLLSIHRLALSALLWCARRLEVLNESSPSIIIGSRYMTNTLSIVGAIFGLRLPTRLPLLLGERVYPSILRVRVFSRPIVSRGHFQVAVSAPREGPSRFHILRVICLSWKCTATLTARGWEGSGAHLWSSQLFPHYSSAVD